jgi:hypothetical protein
MHQLNSFPEEKEDCMIALELMIILLDMEHGGYSNSNN